MSPPMTFRTQNHRRHVQGPVTYDGNHTQMAPGWTRPARFGKPAKRTTTRPYQTRSQRPPPDKGFDYFYGTDCLGPPHLYSSRHGGKTGTF